jgi:hypothetical protein
VAPATAVIAASGVAIVPSASEISNALCAAWAAASLAVSASADYSVAIPSCVIAAAISAEFLAA